MIKSMDSRKSFPFLAESIRSLLGFKTKITSTWVDSVCNIINTLPSQELIDKNHANNDTDTVSKIKDEIAVLTAIINQLNNQRRQVLNELLDLKGNIRVFCRVRPIMERDSFSHPKPVVAVDSNSVLINYTENKSKIFSFDKVFAPYSSQDEVFLEVEPVVKSALDGYNACIFAYGQTGTGKTFTMEGIADFPGIVPRAIEALFKQAAESNHKILFTFSMLEIYMGNLKDLLIPRMGKVTDPLPPCLSIQTSPDGEIEIESLVAINVNDFNQAMKLYRLGRRFRSTGSTESNKTSSRSHCMIRISMSCFDATERRRLTNKLWLVDLGGSERVLKTKARGKRFDEGKAINLSLSALGDVIHALQTQMCHIPYRNSKLTQVLQDSLGKDSKTLMLVHISPSEEDLCETISSLNFATRVMTIHLGNKESAETRMQKEFSISNLQQKMKQIEDKRSELRGQIRKLNEKLEKLTGVSLSPKEQWESSHILAEEPRSSMRTQKVAVTVAASSDLPRFMRPTLCSRRRSGIPNQIMKEKPLRPPRRRKPPLHRAESVSFPIDCRSRCNSESTTSRTSCLVNLQTKFGADNQTESSEDTSDYDMRTISFTEQEESLKSLKYLQSYFTLTEGDHENGSTKDFTSEKLSQINRWFHSHELADTNTSLTYWNKRMLAIPSPEKKISGEEQIIVEDLYDLKVHNDESRKEKGNHIKETHSADKVITQESAYEATSTVLPVKLEEFEDTETKADEIFPSHPNDSALRMEQELLEHDHSIEYKKEDEKVNVHCKNWPGKLVDYNDVERQHVLAHYSQTETMLYESAWRPFCDLPMDKENKKYLIRPGSESLLHNSGIYNHLKNKVEIFCYSILVGLGFQSLGFENDLFYALIL